MEKPKVFANPINKKINNSQEVYIEDNKYRKEDNFNKEDILKKINRIFSSVNHVYKSKVRIITNNDEFICDIVGQTSNSLLTLDGQTIRISDIKDIKKI